MHAIRLGDLNALFYKVSLTSKGTILCHRNSSSTLFAAICFGCLNPILLSVENHVYFTSQWD
jgi:hypothetical protein